MARLTRNRRLRRVLHWAALSTLACAAAIAWVAARALRRPPPIAAAGAKIEGLTRVLDARAAAVRIAFEDVSASCGLDAFRHFPGRRGSLLPEDMGSGVAVGDYDGDGDEDVYLVNFCAPLSEDPSASPTAPGANALLRNDSAPGTIRFTDVTDQAGVGLARHGMGAAWGDYDNDGDLDLYVTNYGENVLFRNEDDGTFSDVTDQAGVGDPSFSAGCGWMDYDRDGNIDLYVCNYVQFEFREGDRLRLNRQYSAETPYTINPSSYDPAPNRLYRNLGDGTFADVAPALGVHDPTGRSLAVAWVDIDFDGWPDLYVANDISANAAFRNLGADTPGAFEDAASTTLLADYRGAMGLATDDFDRDGDLDLLVTHWLAQENALYVNASRVAGTGGAAPIEGMLSFFDEADRSGLGQSSLDMVGWACGFVDLDNDGWSDLWVANGSTLQEPNDPHTLAPQRLLLYQREPAGRFFELGPDACPALATPFVGRGGAHADFDGDGLWDILIVRFGTVPLLLRNTSPAPGRALDMSLRQLGANTQALGARIEIQAGGATRVAQVGAGGSYLSQHSALVHVGLGEATQVDELIIHWPDGATETHRNVPAGERFEAVHAAAYLQPSKQSDLHIGASAPSGQVIVVTHLQSACFGGH